MLSPRSDSNPIMFFWTKPWLLSEIIPAVTRRLDVLPELVSLGINHHSDSKKTCPDSCSLLQNVISYFQRQQCANKRSECSPLNCCILELSLSVQTDPSTKAKYVKQKMISSMSFLAPVYLTSTEVSSLNVLWKHDTSRNKNECSKWITVRMSLLPCPSRSFSWEFSLF